MFVIRIYYLQLWMVKHRLQIDEKLGRMQCNHP